MPLNLIQKNDMIKTQKERKQNMANINGEHREMEQENTQKEEQGVQEVLPANIQRQKMYFLRPSMPPKNAGGNWQCYERSRLSGTADKERNICRYIDRSGGM